MKYYEIKVVSNSVKSFYEGRFYIEANALNIAVDKVKKYLEIDKIGSEWRFFTRELTYYSYMQKSAKAELFAKRNRQNIRNLQGENDATVGNCPLMSWENIVDTITKYDKNDKERVERQYDINTSIRPRVDTNAVGNFIPKLVDLSVKNWWDIA